MAGQIRKPLQFTWRGRPVRPFALGGNRADARPSIALHSDRNAIANGPAATEHVVESPLAGTDDNGSCCMRARVIHHFARNDAVDDPEGSRNRPHLAGALRSRCLEEIGRAIAAPMPSNELAIIKASTPTVLTMVPSTQKTSKSNGRPPIRPPWAF